LECLGSKSGRKETKGCFLIGCAPRTDGHLHLYADIIPMGIGYCLCDPVWSSLLAVTSSAPRGGTCSMTLAQKRGKAMAHLP
jgi:hypothetical protein